MVSDNVGKAKGKRGKPEVGLHLKLFLRMRLLVEGKESAEIPTRSTVERSIALEKEFAAFDFCLLEKERGGFVAGKDLLNQKGRIHPDHFRTASISTQSVIFGEGKRMENRDRDALLKLKR
jgi:hypothetical protein